MTQVMKIEKIIPKLMSPDNVHKPALKTLRKYCTDTL